MKQKNLIIILLIQSSRINKFQSNIKAKHPLEASMIFHQNWQFVWVLFLSLQQEERSSTQIFFIDLFSISFHSFSFHSTSLLLFLYFFSFRLVSSPPSTSFRIFRPLKNIVIVEQWWRKLLLFLREIKIDKNSIQRLFLYFSRHLRTFLKILWFFRCFQVRMSGNRI